MGQATTLVQERAPGPGAAVRLSAACAVGCLVAGLWTAVDPGLLSGPEAMQGSARGTALVLVVVAVPLLLLAARAAAQGSASAVVAWAGALMYVVYNAVLLLFLTPFNAAFLSYVVVLATGLWSLAALASAFGVGRLGARFEPRRSARPVSLYVATVAAANILLWLATVVPASFGPFPARFLDGTGVQTNAIYVQDLAVWLPLASVGAWWLWRREPRGLVVTGAVSVLWVIESLSIAVDQWWGHHADPTSSVVSGAVVLPFAVLALVGVVPAVALLRSARPWRDPPGVRSRGGAPRRERSR